MLKRFIGLSCIWTFLGVLGYSRYYLQQAGARVPINFWPGLLDWLPCYWAWIPLTPLIFRLEKSFPLFNSSWRKSLPVFVATSVFFSYIAYVMVSPLSIFIHWLEQRALSPLHAGWAMPLGEFCIEQFMFWSVVGAATIIRRLTELQVQQREAAQFALEKADLEATLRKAELELLRMRLNPHFLFNSLQNISVLAQQEPRVASRMLTRLGDLLRAAFKSDFQSEVTLDAEIDLTLAYLDIEKMRCGDRLHIHLDIAPHTRTALVPSLILQPLVENAILHGLNGIKEEGRIVIRTDVHDGRLILSVSDNGIGFTSRGDEEIKRGVGLASVYDRLARMYPGQHEVAVHCGPDGGTEIQIALPWRQRSKIRVVSNESSSLVNSR
jgi:two-component system, LytTR family, sensor kinase